MQQKLQSNKMTREQLRETIQVNFELFKDDPNFYDYITTLVVYLTKYEYEDTAEAVTYADDDAIPLMPSNGMIQHMVLPGLNRKANHCRQCHGELKTTTRICPYCLSMNP